MWGKLKNLLRRGRREEEGNIVIELALVLPFLLLVIGGILDFAMLYWEKQLLTNASQEGARAAARANAVGAAQESSSGVQAVVQAYLNKFNLKTPDGSRLTLDSQKFSYTWDTSVSPTRLTVRLQNIPVKMMLLPNAQALLSGGSPSDQINLSAGTTMAAEWSTAPQP